jgi:hypothetical protein
MRFEVAQPWLSSDKSVYFVHNFTDAREGIEVKDLSTDELILNETIADNEADYMAG